MTGPLISFLTDFGLRDPSAAIMRGVVLWIVPDARIVDKKAIATIKTSRDIIFRIKFNKTNSHEAQTCCLKQFGNPIHSYLLIPAMAKMTLVFSLKHWC